MAVCPGAGMPGAFAYQQRAGCLFLGNERLNTMWPGGKLCRVGGIVSEKPHEMQSRRQSKPAGRGDGMLHLSAEYGALFNAVTAGAGPGKGSR